MSSWISMMEAKMPPGFRFHPRDDELVLDYLLHKLSGHGHHGSGGGAAIVDVDLNNCEPWDLPESACVGGKEWYFFSLRDRKYATGQRTNRATRSGYWKATGKDRAVFAGGGDDASAAAAVVGMRKTLVFYRGRAPKGRKTEWVMHEFRLHPHAAPPSLPPAATKEDWVLCRVFYKSRTTTSRPESEDAQYGTPSAEPELLAALPLVSHTDACTAFGGAPTVSEQVSCFSGLQALPFKRPVSLGDLLALDASEKEPVTTVMSSVSNNISSVLDLDLTPNCNWNQENGMLQMWNPLGI